MPKLKPGDKPAARPDYPDGGDDYDVRTDQAVRDGVNGYDESTHGPSGDPDSVVDDRGGEFDFIGLEEVREYLNVCYYGREGTTKTTALASMANLPDPGRVLVVNAEGGLKKTALQRRGIDTSRIVTWPKPGVRATYESLERLFWKVQSDLLDDPNSWLGVGFDSGTEISTVVLEDATTRGIALGQSQGKSRFDSFVVDRDDYRVMTDQMRSLIRKYRDLPCHFVITALEREDTVTLPSGAEVQMWGPAFSPKLAQDVLGYVDMAIRTQADRIDGPDGAYTEVVGYTRATKGYRAKDRFGVTPDPLSTPSFDRLVQYISGDYDDHEDILQTNMLELRDQTAAHRAQLEAEKQAAKDAVRAARRPPAKKTAPAAAEKEDK